jgi:tetratricopeptide (TPR) repeat protein
VGGTLTVPQALDAALDCYRRGALDDAERLTGMILAAIPLHPQALNLRGLVRLRRGEPANALDDLRRAREAAPDFVDAHFNYALACAELGRASDALAGFENVLRLRPGEALAWNNRGNVLQRIERWDDALASYERAIALRPDYIDAIYNRAATLQRLGRWEEALHGHEQVLRSAPEHADALNNRAAVLYEVDRHEEALADFDAALRLRPAYAEAHVNKARLLQALGRWDDALAELEAAVRIAPNLAEAGSNRALLLLLLGDFERGWPAYERRRALGGALRDFERDAPSQRWTGTEALERRTILLHAEQGHGDAIHFARYVPLVAQRAARVIVEVDEALRGLFANSLPGATVIARGNALPAFDLHCPLGSLALAFATTLETIPPPVKLRAPEGKVAEWTRRLGEKRAKRVGIAWAGNPRHVDDRRRSIPVETIAALFDVPCEFHVLQKERIPDGMRERFPNVRVWGDALGDFSETAALIAHLDLVITVDTVLAHLAASMGKATGVLVGFVPDFRWLLGRSDSPWYPSARLFRQPRAGDWASVIAEVRPVLEAFRRAR